MKNKVLFFVLFVASTFPIFSLSINIRSFDHTDFTRIVFEGDRGFAYKFNPSENAIKIKLNEKAKIEKNINVLNSVLIDRVVHHWEENSSVFQVHMKSDFKIMRNFVLEQPFRVVFDLTKSPPKKADEKSNIAREEIDGEKPQQEPEEKRENQPPAETGKKKAYDLIRTICLDPGHGGSDLGAVGRSELLEKNITLKVAKKLKVLIESKLGLHVVMTRESDEEVSLNSRVAKANNQKAQIFISIHVNSSYRKAASGPETYYVSLKATDKDAFLLSQKENSAFKEEFDKLASDDELKMILWDMAQNEYIKKSAKLADFIQYELNILMHTRNRGVKQAPFRVLMRAAMPAILVEIAFVSNYSEEKKLKDDAFLGKVAAALYKGISKYIYYHNNLYK
ncbi:MAG: N-acetylmuramoyl-L-alanine amidase [Candidatus Aminicenantes bacterium]|jgi:N-acetylmuramoyl-L-alanine amidase